jgi:hypothetical protein
MIETVEQKVRLHQAVHELYERCDVTVEPLFPKILVRVLPREQKIGSIWLPDKKQNKPVWEGVVLKVYKPFYQKIYLSEADWVADDPDPEIRYTQKVECALQPGDHVLFPHIEFGIVPTPMDEGRGDYRCVPEHVILCTLDYHRETRKEWLTKLLNEAMAHAADRDEPEYADTKKGPALMAEYIIEHADIVRRDIPPLTISGSTAA